MSGTEISQELPRTIVPEMRYNYNTKRPVEYDSCVSRTYIMSLNVLRHSALGVDGRAYHFDH